MVTISCFFVKSFPFNCLLFHTIDWCLYKPDNAPGSTAKVNVVSIRVHIHQIVWVPQIFSYISYPLYLFPTPAEVKKRIERVGIKPRSSCSASGNTRPWLFGQCRISHLLKFAFQVGQLCPEVFALVHISFAGPQRGHERRRQLRSSAELKVVGST